MNIGERLTIFKEYLNISLLELERLSGLEPRKLDHTKENIKTKYLESIHKAFPELNISWLMTGSGEMLVKEPATINEALFNTLLNDEAFISELSNKLLKSSIGKRVIENTVNISKATANVVNQKPNNKENVKRKSS